MEIPIPDKVKKIWDAWDVRVSIILSLFFQIYLGLFASLRQRRRSTPLLISIWSAYLLADWIAAVAIGQITKTQADRCQPSSQTNNYLYAFWASFLLSHLGGPDSITSFALEDNEFWLRHLFGLIAQVLAVAYSLFLTLPNNNLWIPTVLVFLVGSIKFSERTYSLYLASVDRFAATVLPDPNPGLDYEEAVAIYSLTRCSRSTLLPKEAEKTKITPDVVNYEDLKFALEDETEASESDLDDLKLLQFACFLFQRFKGLIAGFVLSSQYRDSSRNFFLQRNASEAFRLIEYELGFMYQVLHTKVEVIRCKVGYLFRLISFFFLIASLGFWLSEFKKHNNNYAKFDASLTYALIIGALGLGFVSDLKLIFSDLTLISLKDGRVKGLIAAVLATLKEQRWAGSISQYNLITHCLAERSIWIYKLAGYLHLEGFLDKLKFFRFSYSIGLTEELKSFIFYELRRKSLANDNVKDAKEACSQRGKWVLLKQNPKHSELLKWSISQFQYAESLLIWHLATEVCCRYKPESNYEESDSEDEEEGERACCAGKQAKSLSSGSNKIHEDFSTRVCKHLSDYTFYLLIDQPTLLAPVLGNWQLVFQDTCADAKRFFSKYSIHDHSKACNAILSVKTKIRPYVLKGNRCNSVFFDACILANQLLGLKKFERWKVMDQVWVELLCYGAINCRPIVHAQQPSRGGELLTFTWLLMYHLGLGTQFHEQQDQHEEAKITESNASTKFGVKKRSIALKKNFEQNHSLLC